MHLVNENNNPKHDVLATAVSCGEHGWQIKSTVDDASSIVIFHI